MTLKFAIRSENAIKKIIREKDKKVHSCKRFFTEPKL